MEKNAFTPRENKTDGFEVYFVGEKGNAIAYEFASTAYAAADHIISYSANKNKLTFVDELSERIYVVYPKSNRCICLGSYKTVKALAENLEQGTASISLVVNSLAEIIINND